MEKVGHIIDVLKKNTMLIALAAVLVIFEFFIKSHGGGASMFSPQNVTNLISQNSYVVILACGMLLCIIAGGNIDLSVGSIVALVGAFVGKLMVSWHVNIYISMIACIALGIIIGSWHGFWIAYMRIPAFIVTLAGMLIFRGISLLILDGKTIAPLPESYEKLFNSSIDVRFFIGKGDNSHAAEFKSWLDGFKFGKVMLTNNTPSAFISLSVIIAFILSAVLIITSVLKRLKKQKNKYDVEPLAFLIIRLVIICAIVVSVAYILGNYGGLPVILILLAIVIIAYNYYTANTVPGRRLYAMGGNEKAAKLSGIDTNRILFFTYANMGFLSAISALVCVARYDAAATTLGTNFELDAIGACFIGGASAYGGVGKVFGAVIGAVFMGVLNNGMSLLSIDANWQRTVKGAVLLAAVVFDVLSQKRKQSI